MVATATVPARVARTIDEHGMADDATPVLLMVSGGSDSTALAYLAHDLSREGRVGPLGIMHLNHCLRGRDADEDEEFVRSIANALDVMMFSYRVDVAALAERAGGRWRVATACQR